MNTNTKGRLKLPGQEVDIPFTMTAENDEMFSGHIANVKQDNVFYKASGWIFEADVSELPRDPGYYVSSFAVGIDGVVQAGAAVLQIHSDHSWSTTHYGFKDNPVGQARELLESAGLTKVKLVVA